jgi:Ni/Fe-hydrogenase subunit HybB-like protein
MNEIQNFNLIIQGTGVGVMVVLAVIALWFLSGRRFPRFLSMGLLGWIFLIGLWGVGGYVLVLRYTEGLGPVTNLSDTFPWGIWKGTVLWGIAISAGGFVTAGSVYIFRLEKLHSVLRPAVLAAYLGYLFLGVGSLVIDIGRSYRIWHPIIYWQHHSVLFEVAWCVILYTVVLTVEFLPILLEKLQWNRILRIVRSVTIPFVIAGVVLSTLHQSSLGGLFLIVPRKLLPLWYSPFLHLFFFISAVSVGLAMMIFVFTLTSRFLRKKLETEVIETLAKGLTPLIVAYLFLRAIDLTVQNGWVILFNYPYQGITFMIELGFLVIGAFLLLNRNRLVGAGSKPTPTLIGQSKIIFIAAIFVILGVVLNRLNVVWFGMLPLTDSIYIPSWQEVIVTLNLISFAFVLFALAARYLPLFEPHSHPSQTSAIAAT